MKPQHINTQQEDLFAPRISQIIDPKHVLKKLADTIDWPYVEKELDHLYTRGPGQPPKPIRLIVGLLMLQHTTGISDEQVVATWRENLYWQYFCGYDHVMWQTPLEASSLVRWRKRIKPEGMNKILQMTVLQAQQLGIVKPNDLKKVIVDTTVMEKNIAHPTDSNLLNRARQQLVKLSKACGIQLRQNYNRVAKKVAWLASRYAHAKQYKRKDRCIKQLKTYLGRVIRDVERQISTLPAKIAEQFQVPLAQAKRLLSQEKTSKNKLYSLHEPAVYVVAKGKVHKPYEFGCKVALAITHKQGLAISAQALESPLYDGHTLAASLSHAATITGYPIQTAFVDKGYRKHGVTDTTVYLPPGKCKNLSRSLKKSMKRRSAIEPAIGHMKNDGKMRTNYLKGLEGDKINAILCAVGHNMKMLLAAPQLSYA